MKLRFFTFLVSFLMVMSGAVWGQNHGTKDNPLDLSTNEIFVNEEAEWFITSSSKTSNGITVERGIHPKIHLMNVDIEVEGTAIELNGGAQATFILDGTNVITSTGEGIFDTKSPAISVPFVLGGEEKTQATFEGTGMLIINMADPDRVAIGNAFDTGGENDCGNVFFKGGTIKTNGVIGRFYNILGKKTYFNLDGNGVVIGGRISGPTNLSGGILFENTTNGKMYGNVTLNSPLDLTDNANTATLDLQEGTLTLGKGITLKRDMTEDITGGTIVAFDINYSENAVDGCSATAAKPDYNLYGTETEITLETELPECSGSGHNHTAIGWCKGENATTIEASTIKTENSYAEDEANNHIPLNAAWVETVKNIAALEDQVINIEDGYNKILVHPSTLNVTYAAGVSDPSLSGVTFNTNDGTYTGTPAQSTSTNSPYVYNPTVTPAVTGGKQGKPTAVKVTISVKDAPIDISKGTVELYGDATYTYDGSTFNPIKLTVNENVVGAENYTCTYSFTANGSNSSEDETVCKAAGKYVLTKIEAKGNAYTGTISDISSEIDVEVQPRTLKISINDQTVAVNGIVNTQIVAQGETGKTTILIDDQTTLANETPAFKGQLSCKQATNVPGVYEDAITGDGVQLKVNNNFNPSNYKLEIKKKGKLTVTKDITDPGDVDIRIEGAETEDGNYIYNGVDYATLNKENIIIEVKIGEGYIKVPTDNYEIKWNVSEVKNVGSYDASITFNGVYGSATVEKTIEITPRPLTVDFNIANPITEDEVRDWNIAYIEYDNLVKINDKLETPNVSKDCHLEIVNDKVVLKGFELKNNETSGFIKNNYKVTYKNNGKDVTIKDGDDTEFPDIDIEDPDHGGGIVDYNDLHIIKSTGATLTSRYNKMKTPDGGSFTLSLEKEEGYEDCEPTVYIKRGRFDEWKVLKLDEVSGFYQIRNVYTDIYVKVSGDGIWPVSNEEVEAQEVKVYTQNGAIIVSTPSLMDVQVISMTGSVVAADKVAGQREFRNLAEGVYIVRVGDKIVKVRL